VLSGKSVTPKILAFAGSLRTGSFNKKLVRIAAEGAKGAGADVTLIDLRDLPMPIYDGDIEKEQGLPPNAKTFKRLLIEHDGILISTPEYNSQYPAVLKNAIDWASRQEAGEPSMIAFRGKVAAITSVSPGVLGAMRGQMLVRSLLLYLGTVIVPTQIGVSRGADAFDEAGRLKDEKQQAAIQALGAELTSFVRRLSKSA
jgi:NAD(P)H-dependent FMN reductase